jgi:hypothetical protein
MLIVLVLFAVLVVQAVWLYSPNARGNAINDKWRMYETAKRDPYIDRNYRYFMLSNSTRFAGEDVL